MLKYYFDNGSSLYKTCQEFDLNTKNVLRWIKYEHKIRKSKRGARLELYKQNLKAFIIANCFADVSSLKGVLNFQKWETNCMKNFGSYNEGAEGEGLVV